VTAASLHALERFLFPNGCVVCDLPVGGSDADRLVCGLCRSRVRSVGQGCARCQQPLPPVGPCRFCRSWPSVVGRVRSAVWLDQTARPIAHHLKYDGLARVAEDVGQLMARFLPRPDAGFLIPIPLSRARQRMRGYNQAEAIARALGRHWSLPVAAGVMRRVRDTGTQTALAPDARARNMHQAFIASMPPAGIDAASPPVILVDDVLTTGATLVAGATALGDAGWKAIDAVTFARALPYDLRVP